MRQHFPDAMPSPVEWALAQVDLAVRQHGGAYFLMRVDSRTYAVCDSRYGQSVSKFTLTEVHPPGTIKVQRTVATPAADPGVAHPTAHTFPPFHMSPWDAPVDRDDDDASLDILAELIAEDIADHAAKD